MHSDVTLWLRVSLRINEKTALQGGFSKVKSVGELLNRGNRVNKTAAAKFLFKFSRC